MQLSRISTQLFCLSALIILTSGIIRHDVDKSEYIKLAAQTQFDCVGALTHDGVIKASGVLIDEYYVLTAAHIFIESIPGGDSGIKSKHNNNPITRRIGDLSSTAFVFNDQSHEIEEVTVHPNSLRKNYKEDAFDLALIKLKTPCTSVTPAHVNTQLDELRSDVVGVGFGQSGTAGQIELDNSGYKIAGENVIDSIGGNIFNGQPVIMYCDFDHPTDASCNKMGSSTPKRLEYLCAAGDSGGGLFREANGKWELIGICKGSTTDPNQLLKSGWYGQKMRWTRISVVNDWIKENI